MTQVRISTAQKPATFLQYGPDPALGFAVGAGFSVGVFWVAGSFGVNYLFELKSAKLWLINGGYHAVQFVLYGVVFGLV